MPVQRIPADTARQLVRPAWLRGGITAAFALFTIFWTDETHSIAQWALAAFFVLGATAVWDYIKADAVPEKFRAAASVGLAVWWLFGVGVVFAGTSIALAIVAGIGFLGMGAAELTAALRVRGEFLPARDHIILGVIGILTAAGLFLGVGLDPHGILGISGMGVVVMAVVVLIQAGGFTSDMRRADS